MSNVKKKSKPVNIPLINKKTVEAKNLKDLKLQVSNMMIENECYTNLHKYFVDLNNSLFEDFKDMVKYEDVYDFINKKIENAKDFLAQVEHRISKVEKTIDNLKDSIIKATENDPELNILNTKVLELSNQLVEKEHQIMNIEQLINSLNTRKNSIKSMNSEGNQNIKEFEDFNEFTDNSLLKVFDYDLKNERNNFAKYSRHVNYLIKEINLINSEIDKIEKGMYPSKDSTTDKSPNNEYMNEKNIREEKIKNKISSQEKLMEELDKELMQYELSNSELEKEITKTNEILSSKFQQIVQLEKDSLAMKKGKSQTARLSNFI